MLAATGAHPNVARTLVVGLGCEQMQAAMLAEEIRGRGGRAEALQIQGEGGEARTIDRGSQIARAWQAEASAQGRVHADLTSLCVAVECGGSDATSGLASNPVAGMVADRIVAGGGTIILSETQEIIGAEHLMARRAASAAVAEGILQMVSKAEREALDFGVDLRGSQPTQGTWRVGSPPWRRRAWAASTRAGRRPCGGRWATARRREVPGCGSWTRRATTGRA